MPAHLMHRKTPRLIDVQSGSGVLQSAQREFSGNLDSSNIVILFRPVPPVGDVGEVSCDILFAQLGHQVNRELHTSAIPNLLVPCEGSQLPEV